MSKNPKFAYEAQEPAFLQRLRGQYGSGDTSGRLERPAARPRKVKDPKDDEEDEPVYIDEESNEVITKEEYKALAQGETTKETEGTAQDQSTTEEGSQKQGEQGKQSNLTEVGGQRKRKQAKVVGEESKAEAEDAPKAAEKAEKPKKSKKAKKIKLSFDEE